MKLKLFEDELPDWIAEHGADTPFDLKVTFSKEQIENMSYFYKNSIFNVDAKGNFRFRLNFLLEVLIYDSLT